ncbi:uncharacterized protein si:ch211-243a20.4 [Heptranchias perlo]|uniref:uncharacterized protein si:ch211-243a20.4 n=1 Tax=Heptranchias perlo TaxID=212740 RepID=UPI003559DB07
MNPVVTILMCLVLYFRQGRLTSTCQISQGDLIITAVVNQSVKIPCVYTCKKQPHPNNPTAPPPTEIKFIVQLFKDHTGNIIDTWKASAITPNFNKGWQLSVQSVKSSGMYYCTGQSLSKTIRGGGTYLQVREAGYAEPPPSLTLRYVSVGMCVVLALYSVSATISVLIKRKTCCQCKSHLKKTPPLDTVELSAADPIQSTSRYQQVTADTQTAEPADTDSAYMGLQAHRESLYTTLHSDKIKNHKSSTGNESPKDVQTVETEAEAYECVYESF